MTAIEFTVTVVIKIISGVTFLELDQLTRWLQLNNNIRLLYQFSCCINLVDIPSKAASVYPNSLD